MSCTTSLSSTTRMRFMAGPGKGKRYATPVSGKPLEIRASGWHGRHQGVTIWRAVG
jgi:hypothetical protein